MAAVCRWAGINPCGGLPASKGQGYEMRRSRVSGEARSGRLKVLALSVSPGKQQLLVGKVGFKLKVLALCSRRALCAATATSVFTFSLMTPY